MAEQPSGEIQERAQSALADSPIFDLRNLRVEHVDDRLLIVGSVSSFYHKQLAQELVRAVSRDVEVVNRADVCYTATSSSPVS